jgi:hypothetical protein
MKSKLIKYKDTKEKYFKYIAIINHKHSLKLITMHEFLIRTGKLFDRKEREQKRILYSK